MTNLEIASQLREQIKEQWPYVSTILALYANNSDSKFTDRIQKMVDKLLPDEVFYQMLVNWQITPKSLAPVCVINDVASGFEIKSLPINQVLFSSEDNPLGILK